MRRRKPERPEKTSQSRVETQHTQPWPHWLEAIFLTSTSSLHPDWETLHETTYSNLVLVLLDTKSRRPRCLFQGIMSHKLRFFLTLSHVLPKVSYQQHNTVNKNLKELVQTRKGKYWISLWQSNFKIHSFFTIYFWRIWKLWSMISYAFFRVLWSLKTL